MNILYVHQYFKTPEQPGGTRSYWIAKELVLNGHSVTVVTSQSSLESKSGNNKNLVEGITIKYLTVDYDQNMGVFRRSIAFLKFFFLSSIFALQQKNLDLVIATSTPLTIGLPALFSKWFRGVPYIFEVRDLWPEVPIQMGAINNSFIIGLLKKLEEVIYKNAIHVVALSPGMADGVLKYISKDKVSIIPNMAKIDKFWPREKNQELANRLNLKDDTFKVIHFGSIGISNGIEYIMESAKLLKDDGSIEFIFAGGGAVENKFKSFCLENNLENVKFLGRFPMAEISEIVNICDVSMVSFLNIPILYTNSPNKLFDSLSAGKPIIVNSAGWTRELVELNSCGFYVNPNAPHELVQVLKYLKYNPSIVRDMGEKSRWLAENRYDKSILCKQFVDLIEKECTKDISKGY